jgi:hypothetical protein
MYTLIRNIHLLLASFSLPFLLMYALSAVQMSHNSWFHLAPAVHERDVALPTGQTDARELARQVMDRERGIRGELNNVRTTASGFNLSIVLPGTVHEVQYDRSSGNAHVKTSVAGFMGMLNRLHHAYGMWHEPAAMNAWGLVVAAVSLALLILGASGIYMWFTRRPERRIGFVLLAVNLTVGMVLLVLIRSAGP